MDSSARRELDKALGRRLGAERGLADRLLAQLVFAERLTALHPESEADWSPRIAQAAAEAAQAIAAGRSLEPAVRRAEEILAPVAQVAKTYTVHCVGHAHIDMNWQWSWPETVAVTLDTFETALALMEEFPEFCLTQGQASVYAIARDYQPDLLERIRRRAQEGRWEVAAASWVEGDKNLASGESLGRHLLYTRRFMRECFGLAPEDVPLAWEPDTFGHAVTIPSIVARGAVRWYYLCRAGHAERPPVFWWEGPDGRRVLVNRDITWYGGPLDPSAAIRLLDFAAKTGLRDWMKVYGVGDHGGGPTRRDLAFARAMDAWPVYPNFRFARARDFFEILEREGRRWPVLKDELNFVFSGCYTSQSAIKRTTRLGENLCQEAEAAAALAWRTLGRPYATERLREAWTNVLFGHFHDILPGSGVRETREYHLGMFQRTAASAGTIRTQALRALAAQVRTALAEDAGGMETPALDDLAFGAGVGRGSGLGGVSAVAHARSADRAFVVFNSCAWPRAGAVTLTLWDLVEPPAKAPPLVACLADGRRVPAQILGGGRYWDHDYTDVAVPASVGGLGRLALVVREGEADDAPAPVRCGAQWRGGEHGHVGPQEMENEFLRVEVDPATGGLAHLVDKASGRDLARPAEPAALLEYLVERPGGMTAWRIHLPKERRYPLGSEQVRFTHTGPNLAAAEVRSAVGDSRVTVTYRLEAGCPWLEVGIRVMWLERGTPERGSPALRMRFPLALDRCAARSEVPWGWIERGLRAGEEFPALRWVDVAQPDGAGCALLNDSKYGYSLDGSTLAATLLRSTYDPDPLPEVGEHEIRLALVPHGKALAPADLVRLGAAFNQPFQVVSTDVHAGRLPAAASAVSAVEPAAVILSAVKKAEDEDALVFRLLETEGRKAKARVALDPVLFGEVAEAVEVDLLERPLADGSAKAERDGFSVAVPAHGIASVRVRFA